MKKAYLFIAGMCVASFAQAQEPQTYKGAYGQGWAEYTYTEDDKLQRMLSGMFKYSDTLEIPGRGECTMQMTGLYTQDKKSASWVASIRSTDAVYNESVTGPFKDGKKSGLWTHRISEGEVDIKLVSASFYHNQFRNKFSYNYAPTEPVGVFKKLSVEGSFDAKGKLDGEWKILSTDMNDLEIEEIMRYQHGVLAFKVKREVASGAEIERYDEEEKVTAFFKNMEFPDSNSVVGDVKYGILPKMTEHPIIIPLMKSWNDTRIVNVSNQYASSIPTLVVPRGEFLDNSYMKCEQEIVLWMDTPKGHKEWLEEQRIMEEYNRHVKSADQNVEIKEYEAALKDYKQAQRTKKDETYPESQIRIVEKLIADRDAKNALLESVKTMSANLEMQQEKMMADEEFMKKQKHLYEAYDLAYGSKWKKMKSAHSRVRTNIDIDMLDPITIVELELYEADLTELKDFQAKVSSLMGKETKDLEKELKKMESATVIYSRLMRG